VRLYLESHPEKASRKIYLIEDIKSLYCIKSLLDSMHERWREEKEK